ncbi:DUF1120 domain-containing protein [Lysobacter sp. GCM10012299]|uniref:DUF1120 domain-containing protein n=1 Tax=Lysobacter sp. GCM10012299 TaxID=3317333 RepID=UPI003605ED29
MKLRSIVLAGVIALAFAPAAFASSQADLTVTGTITPGACIPSLDGGGKIDLGQIAAASLSATDLTTLPSQSITLSVHCPEAATFAIRAQDNRAGSSFATGGDGFFGLGAAPGGEKIGGYSLHVVSGSVTVDSASTAYGMSSTDVGATWTHYGAGGTAAPGSNGVRIIAFAKTAGETTPSAIKDAAMTLQVSPMIVARSQLPTADEITIDGSATLEVVYL